jgi:hypothetical protein
MCKIGWTDEVFLLFDVGRSAFSRLKGKEVN